MKTLTRKPNPSLITLDPLDVEKKERLERRIREGLSSFQDVAEALLEVKTAKLYLDEYETWVEYLRHKWSIGTRYAYRLIESAAVADEIADTYTPPNEAVAREIGKADPGDRQEVARELAKVAEEKPVTAAIAREVVAEVSEKTDPGKSEQLCTTDSAPGKEPPAERPEKPLSIPDKYKPIVVMMIERWYAREAHQLNSLPVAVPETVTRRILALFK